LRVGSKDREGTARLLAFRTHTVTTYKEDEAGSS
jgi:hypothetical protein